MSSSITRLFCIALAAGIIPDAFAERQFSAQAPQAKSIAPRDALTPGLVPAAVIELPSIAASQWRAVREKNARSGSSAMQVGVVRDVNASPRSNSLQWQRTNGGFAMQWRVRVDGSQAMRIALDVRKGAPGLVARFATPGGTALSQVLPRTGLAWGPMLAGSEAIVELFSAQGDPEAIDVAVARIADHFIDPAQPDALVKSQWLAAACQVDLACEAKSDPVLERAGAASVKLNWIDGYSAYACSGTLLNPADGSFRPYVYTAAHCLSTQAAADSLVSFWFYEKAACGAEDAREAVQLAGGAILLATDDALDATLLRLNRTPPAGAVYAGWDTTPPSPGESLTALHHANGEVTKVSHGVVVAPPAYPRFAIAWTSGIVQGGSSGSGAFSRASNGTDADLLMRGGLSSANASCDAPGYGYYSRLDKVWPKIAPWLSVAPEHANATGLWWNEREPGWGLSLSEQGDVAFAVLFTYEGNGRASWLVASALRREANGGFAGALYRASAKGVSPVGFMKLALRDSNASTLEYSVDGRTIAKTLTRQAFNGAAPICVGTTATRADATNYQDLWWDPATPGWGLGLAQQGDTLFATLFTRDGDGRDTWLAGSNVSRQADGSFAGALYRTSLAAADLSKGVKVSTAGSMRVVFADGEHGRATLTIDGLTTVRDITRQVFGPTPPLCR